MNELLIVEVDGGWSIKRALSVTIENKTPEYEYLWNWSHEWRKNEGYVFKTRQELYDQIRKLGMNSVVVRLPGETKGEQDD